MYQAENVLNKKSDVLTSPPPPDPELHVPENNNGAVIPLTAPNFLGLISVGVRTLETNNSDIQFNYKDNPTGMAVMKGRHGKEDVLIPHTPDNDSLINYDSSTGEFVVDYQNSALVVDLLQAHEEVKKTNIQSGKAPSTRKFTFIDIKGITHERMHLDEVDEFPTARNKNIKHSAIFENAELPVPVDDIYCLVYASPGKSAIAKARLISSARRTKSKAKHMLRKIKKEES